MEQKILEHLLTTLTVGIATYVITTLKYKLDVTQANNRVTCSIARILLRRMCKDAIKAGYIDYDTKEDILNGHEAYEELCQAAKIKNHVMDDLIEQVKRLPTK